MIKKTPALKTRLRRFSQHLPWCCYDANDDGSLKPSLCSFIHEMMISQETNSANSRTLLLSHRVTKKKYFFPPFWTYQSSVRGSGVPVSPQVVPIKWFHRSRSLTFRSLIKPRHPYCLVLLLMLLLAMVRVEGGGGGFQEVSSLSLEGWGCERWRVDILHTRMQDYPPSTEKKKRKRKRKKQNPSSAAFNATKAVTRIILEEHPDQINRFLVCNRPEIIETIAHKEDKPDVFSSAADS